MSFRSFLAGFAALSALSIGASAAFAQAVTPPVNAGTAGRQGEQAQTPPLAQPTPTPQIPVAPEPQLTLGDKQTLTVKSFVVDGPALVAPATVHAALAPYEGKALTIGQIYEAAGKVTALYRDAGYLVATAYVPQQNASDGTLHVKVIAGQYGQVKINDSSRVSAGFLQGVAAANLPAGGVIQRDQVERAMLSIYDLPGAALPKVAIGPGQVAGTSDFAFDVGPTPMFTGYALGDNYGSPFTGRDRLSGEVDVNSPLGIGDKISIFAMASDPANLTTGRLAYALPVGYSGLRAEFSASRTEYVIGGGFKAINATGTADSLSAQLTYPIWRQRAESLYLSGNLTHRHLIDKLLGASFADRTADLSTLGVTNETNGSVAGLPLTTSATVGLTAGNIDYGHSDQLATNMAGPDTQGFYGKLAASFTGTVVLTQQLSATLTAKAQQSLSGNLDSSEQMGLTGYYGVRSYDEGLSGDSGFLVTPSVKYALPAMGVYSHAVGVFSDMGAVHLASGGFTTTQRGVTELNDIGAGYYGTYEWSTGRYLLLKAELAHAYGSVDGAAAYKEQTKALLQVGATF